MVTDEMIEAAIEAYREGTYRTDEQVYSSVSSIVAAALEAALSAVETAKPYGYVYESTVRYCDGRGPYRKVDFFHTKKNISDDDIEEFEITETAVYSALSAQVQDVAAPEGWQLVPKEPTPEMVVAAKSTTSAVLTKSHATEIYRAMLAAAPTKQEGGE